VQLDLLADDVRVAVAEIRSGAVLGDELERDVRSAAADPRGGPPGRAPFGSLIGLSIEWYCPVNQVDGPGQVVGTAGTGVPTSGLILSRA